MSRSIHPAALVDPEAEIGPDVVIDAYALVGPRVRVGPGTRIRSHAQLIRNTVIGARCDIHAGAVVGGDPQDLKFQGEETDLIIGDGNIIREYATINRGTALGGGRTTLGDNNMIMAYVHIAHDCHIGNGCIITNATQLAGHIVIEDMAILSGFVAVHHFVTIGTMALLSGHAVVRSDAPPYMILDGHPARVRKLNTEGMRRRNVPPESIEALRRAYRILYREGGVRAEAIAEIEATPLAGDPCVANLIRHFRASEAGRQGRAREALRTDQHTKSVTRVMPKGREGHPSGAE